MSGEIIVTQDSNRLARAGVTLGRPYLRNRYFETNTRRISVSFPQASYMYMCMYMSCSHRDCYFYNGHAPDGAELKADMRAVTGAYTRGTF